MNRADMCVLLFDPHKLDISGEMASVLEAFEGNEAKARVVLNKADSVPLGEMIKARARRALARSGPSGMKLRPLSLSLSRCTARSCGRSARCCARPRRSRCTWARSGTRRARARAPRARELSSRARARAAVARSSERVFFSPF